MNNSYGSLFYKSWWLFLLLLLVACTEREGLAPVVEPHWREVGHTPLLHRVIRGETLYAIAFRYDLDYRQLAVVNHLSWPYTLQVGQVLHLQKSVKHKQSLTAMQPRAKRVIHSVQRTSLPPASKLSSNVKAKKLGASAWLWPAKGKVVAHFVPKEGKKGINIAGKKGDKIRAAASGIVAYAGNGLAGYGNLIIIKHNNQYLTAYGNNMQNLVKEGQQVKAGQVIAEMGMINRRYWGVHFEIRKSGKPVNPMNYLQKG